eukprot:CAMPEP_0115127144 /NCGR_PEP_ID=MMETSP0227-20121206/50198_1 /TAXON_ID=89957 /ORGANISM="Polarella glacialis, Strain CCMP 1383" /LENGTH=176 /DNA_ID=CAMNT_0002531121 /DNA_START=31 /DNA_END=557 /DNA_ORIENTATION=-
MAYTIRYASNDQPDPAGMSVLRFTRRATEVRKAVNTEGTVSNGSRETLRTMAAHSLLGTREQLLLRGASRSHELRASQAKQVTDFPGYMSSTLSGSTLHRWPEDQPSGPFSHADVNDVVNSGDVRARAYLPSAGVKSEVADEVKVANYSGVKYNFVAHRQSVSTTGHLSCHLPTAT